MEEIQETLLAVLDEFFQASRDVIELIDETENLKRIIEAIDYVSETSLKRARLILGIGNLPEKKLRELGLQTETARRKAIIGYNLLSFKDNLYRLPSHRRSQTLRPRCALLRSQQSVGTRSIHALHTSRGSPAI